MRSLSLCKCSLIRWVRIKTIRYPPEHITPSIPGTNYEYTNDHDAVHRLMMTLKETHFEIRDREQALTTLGLDVERESEWMAVISRHPLLFEVSQYRRKWIIERLIVELQLLSTDWVHLILEREQDGMPMLKWLVESRLVVRLYDHYVVYMSRFRVIYSSLLSPRWLAFSEVKSMSKRKGFGWASDSTFLETEYKADGKKISQRTRSVPGSVRRITFTNEQCIHNFGSLRVSDWRMLSIYKMMWFQTQCSVIEKLCCRKSERGIMPMNMSMNFEMHFVAAMNSYF